MVNCRHGREEAKEKILSTPHITPFTVGLVPGKSCFSYGKENVSDVGMICPKPNPMRKGMCVTEGDPCPSFFKLNIFQDGKTSVFPENAPFGVCGELARQDLEDALNSAGVDSVESPLKGLVERITHERAIALMLCGATTLGLVKVSQHGISAVTALSAPIKRVSFACSPVQPGEAYVIWQENAEREGYSVFNGKRLDLNALLLS